MKLMESEKNRVCVEFSGREFSLLTGLVYTADQFFENLDAALYQLDEDEVSAFALKLGSIQQEMLDKPAA